MAQRRAALWCRQCTGLLASSGYVGAAGGLNMSGGDVESVFSEEGVAHGLGAGHACAVHHDEPTRVTTQELGWDYLFGLKDNQSGILERAERLLQQQAFPP